MEGAMPDGMQAVLDPGFPGMPLQLPPKKKKFQVKTAQL